MRIVIDSNRILAALIKDSTTREIVLDSFFEFLAPDFILAEIRSHEERVLKAAGITRDELEVLLFLIFERITIIPESEYREWIELVKGDISDPKDVVYIAACLAGKADGIWTHDPDFSTQNKVNIFTNIDMLRMSGKAK